MTTKSGGFGDMDLQVSVKPIGSREKICPPER